MPSDVITSESVEKRLRQACAELDRRLRAGGRCRAEELLADAPELAQNRDAALELIYTEFATRDELGEAPTEVEYYERFPHLRQDLAALIEVHRAAGSGVLESQADSQGDKETPTSLSVHPFLQSDRDRAEGDGRRRIGQYEILEEIDHGGMGVVYRARQLGLGRTVALKMMLAGHANPRQRARFRAEAEAVARLQHPAIVQIYDVGEQDGCPYLSMEFIDGGSLDDQIRRSPLSPQSAAQTLLELARAIHYAHERGIVHRDLKPTNVLLTREGLPKITDFGLAKQVSIGDEDGSKKEQLTQAGALLGTPSYMAPEQASGGSDQVGPAADVYSLGAILYEMLTGMAPFRAKTPLETLEQVRTQEPLAPSRIEASVPPELDTICLKCLEKQAVQRFVTAAELADDLQRFLAGEPIRARPASVWERAVKWSRRRPAVAALIATVAAVTVVAFAAVTWAWLRAEANRVVADTSREAAMTAYANVEAARAAEHAERERVERLLYDHNIALAYHEYLANNTLRAVQLLDRCRPDLRNWEWRYLQRICNAEELILSGLTMPVLGLAFSPDGKRVAACSGRTNRPEPGEICVWESTTGQILFTAQAQRGPFSSLAFSPDGVKLVAANRTAGVRLWDITDSSEKLTISLAGAWTVAFSPDGQTIAIGCADGRLMLCDSTSGKQRRELKGHDQAVFSVAFSPDGTRIVSGSRDGSVRIWDAADGSELLAMRDLNDVRVVAFSPDGTMFGAVTYSGMIRVWQVPTGAVVTTHHSQIRGAYAALSPDGHSIAVGTSELGTQIWRARTGEHLRTFPVNSSRVSFSPDGTRIATAGTDRKVRIWNLTSEPNPNEYTVTDGARVADMQYSPDGRYLALVTKRNTAAPNRGRNDKTLRIWDSSRRHVVRICTGHSDWLTSIAFNGDGRLIASGSVDKTVRVWATDTGTLQHTLGGHEASVTSVAFSRVGEHLVSASRDGKLRLWNAATGELVRTWLAHDRSTNSVAFAPNGELIASSGADQVIRIWLSSGGEPISIINVPSIVNRLVFSRDGKFLASASSDGVVHLWQVSRIAPVDRPGSAEPLHTFQAHRDAVTGLDFSRDSERLVSAGVDRTVKIWDVTGGDEIITLRAGTGDDPRVVFSPDGRFLTLSLAQEIAIWDSQWVRNEPERERTQTP